MTEAARTLLDRLMGVNRNEDNEEALITDLYDDRICKDYLCGLCPNDLFVNTKEDVGPCQLRHDENLKRKYEESKERGEEFPFERYHMRTLSRWLDNLERRIQKAQDRLVGTGEGPAPVIDVESGKESEDLNAEIADTIKEAEEAAEQGDVTKSMQLMEKAEELKSKKNEAQARAILETAPGLQGAMTTGQKLRVCNVCGALLSIFDSDKRLADHFSGKQHIGYMKIRQRYNELKEKFGGSGSRRSSERSPSRRGSSRDGRRSRDRDDRRGRSRSRDRSYRDDRRDRDRSRHRDRDRDRDRRDRYDRDRRSRDYRRSRSRERSHRDRY